MKCSINTRVSGILYILLFCSPIAAGVGWRGAEKGPYPTEMKDVALKKEDMPKVVAGHPRLYMREKPWKYGPSLQELVERAKKEPWSRKFRKPPKRGTDLALYYLMTKDESVVSRIVEEVSKAKPKGRYGGPGIRVATMYDWICASPSITEEQKKGMQKAISAIGHAAAKRQDLDFMHHWGAGTCPINVLACGLALYGDHPDGEKFLRWALGFFKAGYLPGYENTGGIWQGGGFAYYRGRAQTIPTGIYLMASGLEKDVFEMIKAEYGNWFEGMMHFFMYQILPDCTRAETTGFDYAPRHPFPWTRNFMIFAAGNRSPDAYAFMRWAKKNKYYHMGLPKDDFLLYDEELDKKETRFPDKLPGALIWGRNGAGYAQFRSKGWAPDATVIEFCCGDHIWSHTHNSRQNSFYIYHRGRLAMQTGLYADKFYFGEHTRYWYARTVSCNSMLIIDPDEFTWNEGGKIPGQDKDGFYPEYGGQRLVRGSCNAFTFDEYMKRKTAMPSETRKGQQWQFWETGNIIAFDHADDHSWSYVCGDATQAYNNPKRVCQARGRKNKPKIDLFTRSMVYVDNTYLIIYDRVNSLNPEFRKAWLLHSQGKPEINGKIIKSEVKDHVEEFDGDTVVVTWDKDTSTLPPPEPDPAGRLIIKTLLPEKHYIRRVGGDGYRFWVLGANHPPSREGEKQGDSQDMGRWRIEVSPQKPSAFDNFLHLIHMCDAKTEKAPATEMIRSKDNIMTGIAADGWLVLFGTMGEVKGEVTYITPKGEYQNLIVDLKRNAKYAVAVGSGGSSIMTSSREGVLFFKTDRSATVSMKPVE